MSEIHLKIILRVIINNRGPTKIIYRIGGEKQRNYKHFFT